MMDIQQKTYGQAAPDNLTLGFPTVLGEPLRVFLEQIRRDTGIPGIGVALSIGGEHFHEAVGTVAADGGVAMSSQSRFQLGCITKWLTSVIAAELVEGGELDCEGSVSCYLPELFDLDRDGDLALWHIMSHTSGYQGLNLADPEVAYSYSWPKFQEIFRNRVQLFKPGTVFNYEHSEHVILGEIIRRITGRSAVDLIKSRILEPLGLASGTVLDDPKSPDLCVAEHVRNPVDKGFYKLSPTVFCNFWHASLSPLTLNLSDMVRLGEALMGLERCGTSGGELPSQTAMQLALKQVIALPATYGGRYPEQIPGAFGLGCAAYSGWLLGRSGSVRGQTCALRFDPQRSMVLAVGINAWDPYLRDAIINRIFDTLRGQTIPRAPQALISFTLGELAGRYIGPHGLHAVISIEKSKLICCLNDEKSRQPPLRVVLERDEQGHFAVCSDAKHYSFGFFEDPSTTRPCLMVGLQAFRLQ